MNMAPRTLSDIVHARRTNFSSDTKSKVEHVMGWDHKSFDLVVSGLDPIRVPDTELAKVVQAWPRFPVEVRKALGIIAGQYRRA